MKKYVKPDLKMNILQIEDIMFVSVNFNTDEVYNFDDDGVEVFD